MPDGRIRNGGARPGAGRKAKAAERELRQLLKKSWPQEDREEAFRQASQRAALGSLDALKFLSAYAFGKPVQRVIVEDDKPEGTKAPDLSQLTAEELDLLERAGEILARARRGAGREGAP